MECKLGGWSHPMFQLSDDEKGEVIANCDHLEKLKFSRTNPHAFTEHGTIMLASILNTPTAIQASVLIMRAFVKLREILSANKDLEGSFLTWNPSMTSNLPWYFRHSGINASGNYCQRKTKNWLLNSLKIALKNYSDK
jgi:hypothetical protein